MSVVEVVSGLWSLPHFPGIHWEVCILTWSGSECSTQIILSPSHGTGTLLKFTSLLWAPFSGLFGPEKIPYASPKILQEWRNPGRTFVSGNSPSFLLWCCCLMQTSGSLVPWHFPGFYLVYEAHVLTDLDSQTLLDFSILPFTEMWHRVQARSFSYRTLRDI